MVDLLDPDTSALRRIIGLPDTPADDSFLKYDIITGAWLAATLLLSDILDVTISVANLNSLDNGLDSTLHFHDSDRNRANHTGTQLADTISNFDDTVTNNTAVLANTAKITNATHTGDVAGATVLTIQPSVVDIAMLSATGTPDGTTFLRGDNTWSVPVGSGAIDSINGDSTPAQIFDGGDGIGVLNISETHVIIVNSTVARDSDDLSYFASTTSVQLASIISDETGLGSLVFNNAPVLLDPQIASFANANHNHSNLAGGGLISAASLSNFDATTAATPAVTANTAKVTNATHTGDVAGATILTIQPSVVDIAMLSATGAPSSTTFLRGDNTWNTPAGGGGGAINSINGDTTPAQILDAGDGLAIFDVAETHTFAVNGTIARETDNLSYFSDTTSAQLLEIITDETGLGLLVFNINPTLLSPTIALFVNANHDHTNAAGGGQIPALALSATGTPDATTFLRGDNTWSVPAGGGGALTSINADTTPAQILAAGTGLTILDATETHTYSITAGIHSEITGLGVQAQDLDLGNNNIDIGTGAFNLVNLSFAEVDNHLILTLPFSNSAGIKLENTDGFIDIRSGMVASPEFLPIIEFRSAGATRSAQMIGSAADDTGTSPIFRFNLRTDTSQPIVTRPLFAIQNDALNIAVVAADGSWDFQSNSLAGISTINTHTIPAGTSTFALISDNLSVFGNTTSVQLAGIITDETGLGSLVFNIAPTLLSPTIASFANANHDHGDLDGGGQIPATSISATGTPDATTFLRGDNTWSVPAGAGNIDSINGDTTPAQIIAAGDGMGIINATETHTLSVDATVARDTNNLAYFANTTSAQLLGIITDETGSGLLVFNDTPTLITPTIADFSLAGHDHSNTLNGGLVSATDLTDFDTTTAATPSVTANTAKITNATHTGDVAGATVLTIQPNSVDIAMLSAIGTPDATTFLRGDNTWAVLAGGAGINSINGDTTPAQILAAGTGLTILDATETHTYSITAGIHSEITGLGVQTQDLDLGNNNIDIGTGEITTQSYSIFSNANDFIIQKNGTRGNLTLTDSTAPAPDGFISFQNTNSINSVPYLILNTSSAGLGAIFRTTITDGIDSGTTPILAFSFRTITAQPIVTRPLLSINNGAVIAVIVSANGNWDFQNHALAGIDTINTHTIPAGTSTFALISDNLSVFGNTTSAQLAGIITNETGSGSLVFNNTPTLLIPTIANFSSAGHNHTNTSTGGQIPALALSASGTPDATTFLRGDNTWSAAGAINSINGDTSPAQIIAAGDGMGIINATETHTLSVDATVARDTNNLAYFANTSSTQLASIITDSTGSNNLVFSFVPTLTNPVIANFGNSNHNHTNATEGGLISATSLTNFDATVAATPAVTANTAKITNATHTGDVAGATVLTIQPSVVDIAMLSATGTPSSTTFLRGDNTWNTPAGGGGGDINSINGDTSPAQILAAGTGLTILDATETHTYSITAGAHSEITGLGVQAQALDMDNNDLDIGTGSINFVSDHTLVFITNTLFYETEGSSPRFQVRQNSNTGFIELRNGAGGVEFLPIIELMIAGPDRSAQITGTMPSGDDTGTAPIFRFNMKTDISSSIVTRPLFAIQNDALNVAVVAADGSWDFQSNALAGIDTINTHTIPAGTSTFALISDNLSVFANTSSAQLAGIMTDSTGTGSIVFGILPTLVTPTIADFVNANHDHSTIANGGLLTNTALTAGAYANITSFGTLAANIVMGSNDITQIQKSVYNLSITTDSIDMTTNQLQTISITADTTFTGTGYTTGVTKTVYITTDATLRTLAFPAGWIFVGPKPTSQAASKTGKLTLTNVTTSEAGTICTYEVEE